MAFDGIIIKSIVDELNEKILKGKIDKIYQSEKDEIILQIRSGGKTHKLLITVNSSNPRIHLTNIKKDNPLSPPMFCMMLRKYLSGGIITKIQQPNFERIFIFTISSSNEMGDVGEKNLIVEIMGKHSNIILTQNNIILDSIKRVSHDNSRVREVLPNREYVLPPNQNKLNPTNLFKNTFLQKINENNSLKIQEFIYKSYSGISPIIASEICTRANVNGSTFCGQLNEHEKENIFNEFYNLFENIKTSNYKYQVIYDANYKPYEYSCIPITMLNDYSKKSFENVSETLEYFYLERDKVYRVNQKTSNMRKVLQTTIERYAKKIDIQIKTIEDTKNMEKFKIRGELITANIYSIKKGDKELVAYNYYDNNKEVTIKLDENLTPSENSQKYFKKYNKKKRAYAATTVLLEENKKELLYLESILSSLNTCDTETDIENVRQELVDLGIMKKKFNKKNKIQKEKLSKPLQYKSSDGYDIYVGKNNKQNDYLTLTFAEKEDMWFHTKDIPGSHVIVKAKEEIIPDTTLNEAAHLAAYYSKGKTSSKVPVDYTPRKHIKKPKGSKLGMVIYFENKTAYITPDEKLIRTLEKID